MGIREERLARAVSMPHREFANEQSNDERLESTLGRFFFDGKITASEFDAGIRYGQIVLDYLQSIDAPAPFGRGFEDLTEDACFKRKIIAAQSRQVLKDAAKTSGTPESGLITAIDRLCVYGEAPRTDLEMKAARVGLRALAHGSNIIPFARPARPSRDSLEIQRG